MSDHKEIFILLKDVRPNMKNINAKFIVIDIGQSIKTKDGHEVRTVRIADKSGSMNLSVWNEKGNYMNPGDIFHLLKGNSTVRGSSLTLNVGRYGQLIKIGEFCLSFIEYPFFSEPNPELATKMAELNQPRSKQQQLMEKS